MKKTWKWIAAPKDPGAAAVTFSKVWQSPEKIKKAILSVSAMGVYVPYLNGTRVGDAVLMPGWTSYFHRVQYQEYDITGLIRGKNRLEICVGQGWAVGYIGNTNENHYFADHVSLIAEVRLESETGVVKAIPTDESWNVFSSQIISSEIYHGETVDHTAPVRRFGHAILSDVRTRLVRQIGEWIREQERIAPVALIRTPKGETVLDFGQNLAGYVEIRICAPRGSRIVLHHAEVLDRDGNFYNANYRRARCENVYICSGGEDVFKPSFSFQGFRYVRLTQYPFAEVDLSRFFAVVVHSDLRRTGNFSCGNEKVNQLYHNIVWGQKSNYLDVPTDCPQRDERLGWTGDAQVFFKTAAINFDVEKFFTKWMGDVALEQECNGAVRGFVPHCRRNRESLISGAWGDAACIIPWNLYVAYGHRGLLKKQFPMMKKWVDYLHHAGPVEFLWLGGYHYGDWLAMDAGEDSYVGATSNDLIASAFFAHSTDLLIRAGETLGLDMREYRILYSNIRTAFRAYFMENGFPKQQLPDTEIPIPGRAENDRIRRGDTQTALALILHFGLCEESEKDRLAKMLAEKIRENDGLMNTGFVGTPYLLHALSENGYTDLAYQLLMEERNPSWLYSVCHGATTMWEHWNGIRGDGTFWSDNMNSFNHYAYGAVYDWIFSVCCGVSPKESAPAYREVNISPHPNQRLGWVEATLQTRNGLLRVAWKYKEQTIQYEIDLPEKTTAFLTLPSGKTETLTGGTHFFTETEKETNL